jgi:uncharacterized protein involved in exopolysaccharide biosynthesis
MSQTSPPSNSRSRWGSYIILFFVIFLFVTLAATLYTFFLPESFRSTVRLKLEWGRENAAPLSDPRLVKTEVEVIQSDSVLSNVIAMYDLNEKWAVLYNGGMPLKSSETRRLLRGVTRVQEEPGRNVISITGYNEDAKLCADVANWIADAYATQVAAGAGGLKVTVLEKALPASRPFRPNKPLNIILGMMAGAGLGTLAVVTMIVIGSRRTGPPAI